MFLFQPFVKSGFYQMNITQRLREFFAKHDLRNLCFSEKNIPQTFCLGFPKTPIIFT